jgi:hypothetical protein
MVQARKGIKREVGSGERPKGKGRFLRFEEDLKHHR